MSVAVYDTALLEPAVRVRVRFADGGVIDLPLGQWCGPAYGADAALVLRPTGPTLDIGCGPGRLTEALTARGIVALGIDIAPAAVRLTRARGAAALLRSVFGPVPAAGRWEHALLADGNVGIGGDPVALLARTRDLLAPAGLVHVELGAPDGPGGTTHARLEPPAGEPGRWFPWARLPVTDLAPVAAAADLVVRDVWDADGRWFAELVTRG